MIKKIELYPLGTKSVFVSFKEHKSILAVVFLIKYYRYLEYELNRNEKDVILKPVLQNAYQIRDFLLNIHYFEEFFRGNFSFFFFFGLTKP